MTQFPPHLQLEDLILVVSPSGIVNKAAVEEGVSLLETAGFKVELARHVFTQHFKFAGTDTQRLEDLQYALDHPKAKAVFCARGGFGITHIIDQLDWTRFKENPKWIIGFSDITALLHAAYLHEFASIHASVMQGLSKLSKTNQVAVIEILKGIGPTLTAESKYNKPGQAKGELIGGNLSLLVHQLGTASEIDYQGKILFVEEVGEPLYHIDRMFVQLKRAGKLKGLKGLVVGQFTNMRETKEFYGACVEDIVLKHCSDYNFPIAFNFPFGHGEENWPLVHAGSTILKVENTNATLSFK